MGERTVSCADPSHILMIEMMGSPVTMSSLRNLLCMLFFIRDCEGNFHIIMNAGLCGNPIAGLST